MSLKNSIVRICEAPETGGRRSGSGVVLGERSVLTCRHVVKDAGELFVSSEHRPTPIRAKVAHAGEDELDIAVLELDASLGMEPAIFEENSLRSHRARKFEAVKVYGYPPPETALTATELQLSATVEYQVEQERLLNFQLSGGVREGYSGGPLVLGVSHQEERCAGLIYLGGERAATSRVIAAEQIARRLAEKNIPLRISPAREDGAAARVDGTQIEKGDRALVVSAHGLVGLPDELCFERVVFAPALPDRKRDEELRSAKLKKRTWKKFLDDIRAGLALALERRAPAQKLHIFLQVPYPAAFALGRMLDEHNPLDKMSYRGTPIVLYQLDPSSGWAPFIYPCEKIESEPWLSPMQAVEILPEGEGAILSLQGRHPMTDELLIEEARALKAKRIYRTAAREGRFLQAGAQARAAVEELVRELEALKAKEGGKLFPLHILYSGPVSFCLELGLRLRTTVFGKTVVPNFDSGTHHYFLSPASS